VLDGPACEAHDLGGLEPELALHVNRARREEEMDSRAARARERLARGVDVLALRARERGDGRGGDTRRDGADALEVARRRAREAGLDHVDAEALELRADLRLLVRLQRDARRLLAVAQRRIEDLDPASGHEHVLLRRVRAPSGDAPLR